MIKKLNIIAGITILLSIFSCTKLDEQVYSSIPLDNFFHTEKDVLMNAGRAYTKLQPYPQEFSLWSLTELASDEMVAPARDDGFVWDNGRWDEIQRHAIPSTNKILTLAWQFVFSGISACNEVLYETQMSPIQFDSKDQIIAEIKILRAYFYYWAMDNWGNVPYSIDFTDKTLPVQKNRQFLFPFIIKEITDNIDKLQAQPTSNYYGRVTKGMAYTLLAKMYLNANEWIGTPMWNDAVNACNNVIALGAYHIADDYFSNFAVHNEGSTENIFVIPMQSQFTHDNFYWYTLTLNDASRPTFNFIGAMWDEFVMEPPFTTNFDPNDLRLKSFLLGQQYDSNGKAIILTENGQQVPFIYTATIDNYMSRKRWEGARFCKYAYQPNLEYYITDMENDFVLFRYADVLYTKLEALYRLGRTGEIIADPDFMKIRTRAGLAPYTVSDITDTELLKELGREFAVEGHRRQDQIRFGVYESSWWNKPATPVTDKLFPIPQTVLSTNSNLVQNPM